MTPEDAEEIRQACRDEYVVIWTVPGKKARAYREDEAPLELVSDTSAMLDTCAFVDEIPDPREWNNNPQPITKAA